jgi:predicted GIY-YIG superfamily endonuclease
MYYVYILRSEKYPQQIYIGYTKNLDQRLSSHNNGGSRYTNMYKPWELVTYIVFRDKQLAESFEHYLKTASGRAFLRKRLT